MKKKILLLLIFMCTFIGINIVNAADLAGSTLTFKISGKSTIAIELEKKLFENNCLTFVYDGDNIRFGLNRDLGFSPKDREENIGNYDTSCGKAINSTTACSPIVFDAANERTDSYCKNSVNGCNMFSKNNSVVLKDSTIKTWLETNYVPKIRTSLANTNGGTIENLTVSLPSMEEIATADGKTFNQAIFSQDISNSYLTTTNYWTKTASNTNSSYVWYIAGNNNKNAVEYANNNSQIGIRPVITTSKLNIETVNQ